jgi:hypothetical protein
LHWQAAVAVGQGLGGDAVTSLRPLCLGQRPLRLERDPLTL